MEPKKTELTTYVGLEHLDAENLKIERTGMPNDVIGTNNTIQRPICNTCTGGKVFPNMRGL